MRTLGLAIAVLLLAGCGWQLRGAGAGFEGAPVILDSRPGEGELARLAAATLRDLGASLVDDAHPQAQRLVVLDESVTRATIAVDARGRASEYELRYRLRFRFEDADDEAIGGGTQSVALSRAYAADPLDTLSQQAQAERIVRDLREEAVNTMVARVARLRSAAP